MVNHLMFSNLAQQWLSYNSYGSDILNTEFVHVDAKHNRCSILWVPPQTKRATPAKKMNDYVTEFIYNAYSLLEGLTVTEFDSALRWNG